MTATARAPSLAELEARAAAAALEEVVQARAGMDALDMFDLAGGHFGAGAGPVLAHLRTWRVARAARALAERDLEAAKLAAALPQITDGGAPS